MALIEVFHLVASELPVDPNGTPAIPQGAVVSFDDDGLIDVAVATQVEDAYGPVGLAGDSRSQGTTSYTAESGSALNTHADTDDDGVLEDNFDTANWSPAKGALVTGAWGDATRFTQNRVADNYNEVLSSGKMTVYHSGGEFWTDQFLISDEGNVQAYAAGNPVYLTRTVGQEGRLTQRSFGIANADAVFGTLKNRVGMVLRTGGDPSVGAGSIDYPSGVPGTDTPWLHLNEGGNSMTYGRFVLIKLEL